MPRFLALLALIIMSAIAAAQVIVSPEVHPDRTVTFRYKDPNAKKVSVGIEGKGETAMNKDAEGVWSVTIPLGADIYGYAFNVDGQTHTDPNNYLYKPNLLMQTSMLIVPGTPAELWEVQEVSHGLVTHHFYHSKVVGDDRDYFVYTPPGYDRSDRKRYPVLYLLHGYSDMASAWSAVGMANVILDNLIARGKITPMIVVMPLGYGLKGFASLDKSPWQDQERVKRNYDNFTEALLNEVIPQVESDYRVKADANHRAIAGLSMGGAESLYVGLNNLSHFAYVGAFSTGGLSEDFLKDWPHFVPNDANKKLKQLFVTCGTADGLISFNRKLVAWLKGKGVNVTAAETPGMHEWPVWRRNLITFTQMIFRD